jgi:hypothetical protein
MVVRPAVQQDSLRMGGSAEGYSWVVLLLVVVLLVVVLLVVVLLVAVVGRYTPLVVVVLTVPPI